MLSSCAHVAPECATHGGTPWLELSSEHFVVRTNLAPEEARGATVQLERARASVLAALPSALTAPPLEVVVFTSPAQLHDLSGDPLLDGALTHDWKGPLLLTAHAASFLDVTQLRLMLHQLAHHFSAGALKRWPRWFEEGLAIYLETLVIDPEAKTAVRGRANQERLDEVMRWGILPVQSLWAWDVEPEQLTGLEQHRAASAWFWVHFLFNEHRPALERFMRSLAEGDEPKAAWATAFGDLAPQAMAEAAAAYIARQQTRSQQMDLGQLNTTLTEKPLPDAQVHALLARVAAVTFAWPRARTEARAAMALDPKDARAMEQGVVVQETVEARIAAARVLTTELPAEASGWLLLALALPPGDPERGVALERAVELEPLSGHALSELATFRCAEGRCSESLELVEKAVRLAPGDSRVHAAAAVVSMKAGQCGRAAVSQQRALEVLPHRASAALRAQLRTRLGEYLKCGR
ncbi:MAG: hypothetical protein Q8L48_08945 [Archangium sp.]|nr:hypothetical protein [Archangium sp.]